MQFMITARLVLFAALIVCSVIVIGIASYFTYLTNSVNYYYEAFALAIATACITLACVGASLIVNTIRRGAFTSIVWVELAWVGFLWIMWVATAGSITSMPILYACVDYSYYGTSYSTADSSICSLFRATEAFSWLAWLAVFGWFWALLICSIVAHSKGHPDVWHRAVAEHAIFTGKSTGAAYDMGSKSASPNTTTALPYQQPASYTQTAPYGSDPSMGGYPQQPPYPQV